MAWKYKDLLEAGRGGTVREVRDDEMIFGLDDGYSAVGRYDAQDVNRVGYRGDYGVADNAFMNDEDWNAVQRYKAQYEQAKAAGDQAGMAAAHEAAQQLRYKYGYSGGEDGSGFRSIAAFTDGLSRGMGQGAVGGAAAGAPGGYDSRYSAMIDQLLGGVLNREGFSYDKNTDPLYQQYKESYTRGGKLAMQDVLAELSARTGGLASSYAGGASQQVFNDHMAGLADKVLELYEKRYNMYLDELEQQRKDLDTVLGIDEMYYGRHRDNVGDSQWQQQFDYNAGRDAVADKQWQQQFDYNANQDAQQWYYKLLQDGMVSAGAGTPGGEEEHRDLGKRGGWYDNGQLTTEQVMALQKALGVEEDGLYGTLSQQAAGDGMTADDAYDRYVYGPGLQESHFNASMQSIAQQLAAGKRDAAEGNVNRIWRQLNEIQRGLLNELLDNYGLMTK